MDNTNAIASMQIQVTLLRDWFDEGLSEDWEPLCKFFSNNIDIDPCHQIGVKKIEFGAVSKVSLLLILAIKKSLDSQIVTCKAQLCSPIISYTLTPKTTLLIIEDGDVIFSVQARSTPRDNIIQFSFDGYPGDRFSLRVCSGRYSYCEDFEL